MDRDPNAITDDVKDFDAAVAALDPPHFWKFNDTSGNAVDSGYLLKNLSVTGSPGYAQATGFTGISGVRIATGSFFASSSLTATSTTFSIFAFVKILTDYIDDGALLFGLNSNAHGLNVTHSTRKISWRYASGNHFATALDGLTVRRTYGVGLVVTAGEPQWYLDGVPVDTDDTSPTTALASITPNRVGATAAASSEFRGDLARLAYFPGIALTADQMAELWSRRFSCHTSTLAVVNQALDHIGQNRALTNLSTDTTPSGVAVRLHLGPAIEATLRRYSWPFANRYATLELVDGSEETAVNSDWQYAYRVPDGMVRALRIVKVGGKRAHDPEPIPFRHEQDSLGGLIYTDYPDAELEYTIRGTCPAQQGDVFFRAALAWTLSSMLVPSLSKNERTIEFCLAMAGAAIDEAKAGVANEEVPQDTNDNLPPWLTAR
jgi:hypothetical protein